MEKAVKAFLIFIGSFHILDISHDTNRKGEGDRSLGQKPDGLTAASNSSQDPTELNFDENHLSPIDPID